MSNWCDNNLRLSHNDKSMIDSLYVELSKTSDSGKSETELFQYLIPNPTGEWSYEWSSEKWGPTWEANIIDWNRYDDNTIWISFETVRVPPIALYNNLVDKGWDVEAYHGDRIDYIKGACGFCGRYTTKGGEELHIL